MISSNRIEKYNMNKSNLKTLRMDQNIKIFNYNKERVIFIFGGSVSQSQGLSYNPYPEPNKSNSFRTLTLFTKHD